VSTQGAKQKPHDPRAIPDILDAVQQRDADEAMIALGLSFKMPTEEEDVSMEERADLDEAISRSRQHQIDEAREHKTQNRASQSPCGKLWEQAQRKTRKSMRDDGGTPSTLNLTAVSDPITSEREAIELAPPNSEVSTDADLDRLYKAACSEAPEDERSILEISRKMGCRPKQNKKKKTAEQRLTNNAAQLLQKRDAAKTLTAATQAYLQALDQTTPQKVPGRKTKQPQNVADQPDLNQLYNTAKKSATGTDVELLGDTTLVSRVQVQLRSGRWLGRCAIGKAAGSAMLTSRRT